MTDFARVFQPIPLRLNYRLISTIRYLQRLFIHKKITPARFACLCFSNSQSKKIRFENPMSPEPSRAKAPPAKRWEKIGDKNGESSRRLTREKLFIHWRRDCSSDFSVRIQYPDQKSHRRRRHCVEGSKRWHLVRSLFDCCPTYILCWGFWPWLPG